MAIEVFNRYEKKYIIDEDTFHKLTYQIADYMNPDAYNRNGEAYRISNIYYDTENDQLIRASIEKPVYKEKLRLRAYGMPELTDNVFVEIKKKYKLQIGNFSCHSLRKTFGRQVYNMNNDNSELALVKLMELFNHSSVSITKRYLGLRQEELLNTYDCLSF